MCGLGKQRIFWRLLGWPYPEGNSIEMPLFLFLPETINIAVLTADDDFPACYSW